MARGLALSAFLLATAAHAGTVSVSLPAAGPCRFEPLAAALRARLPGATVEAAPSSSPGAVQLTLERDGEGWLLAIAAPGQEPLHRPLGFEHADCVALFEAAALIADRYLSSIQWTQGPVEVSPLPPPEPTPPLQLLVELAGGAGFGLTGVAPAAQLELGLFRRPWSLELSAAWLGSGQRTLSTATPSGAVLTQQTGAAQVALGRRFALGPGALRVELTPGAEVFWVSASSTVDMHPNPLPRTSPVVVALPFVGGRLGYALEFGRRLSLSLRFSVRAHLGERRFVLEGYPQSLVTHPVDGDVTLALGYLFF